MPDARYRAALERLFRLRRFGMRPGLEVIEGLLEALGDPQKTFRAVHVTGSKGKGSVTAMTARILKETGLRTGRFTSPHLVSYRERMEVNGRMIPRGAVVDGLDRIDAAAGDLVRTGRIDRPPTFFETTTALAFDWFRSQGVQQAVIEVGIGGRLDSTNVLDSAVGVVTAVETEHTEILGPRLTDIAREKAGIFHRGMSGVVGALPEEALTEVHRKTRELGVPLWSLGSEIVVRERTLDETGQRITVATPSGVISARLGLMGSFQATNAALAIGAAQRFAAATGVELPADAIARGLAATRWRGRLERVARRPELFLDAAHTPESAHALAESLAEIAPFSDPSDNAVLFGCLQDKRVEEILDRLAPLAKTLVVVTLASDRAIPAADLLRNAVGRFPVRVLAGTVAEGLKLARGATAREGFTIVAGSDYLVGEVLRDLEGSSDDEPDLSDPLRRPSPEGALSSGGG